MHAQGIALEAARRAGDPAGEAYALYGLAVGYAWSGRPGDILRDLGDRLDEADHPDAGELRAKLQPPGAQPESSPA